LLFVAVFVLAAFYFEHTLFLYHVFKIDAGEVLGHVVSAGDDVDS
jgi:hypothetical protein